MYTPSGAYRVGDPIRSLVMRWALGGLLIFFCLSGIALADHERQHVRVQLKWHHQFQFAGYYAAQIKGYYSDEGLEVELIEGGVGQPPTEQVLAGHAEYGIGDADILLARVTGDPFVALASIFQHSPYILLSLQDSGIRYPGDLVGKKVMLSNFQGAAQFRAVLMKEGIGLDNVEILPHSWNLDDLIERRVDAISAYATVEPAYLRARGYEPSVLHSHEYGVDFYGDTLFTTEQEIQAHPDRVEALLRATRKGWSYAFANPHDIVSYILTLPGVAERGATHEMLLNEARDMAPYVLADVVEPGHMNAGRWQAIADILSHLDLMPEGYDLTGFIYDPSGDEPRPWLRYVGHAVLSGLLILVLVLLWNLQMHRQVRQRTQALEAEAKRREAAENLLAIAGNTAKLGGWALDLSTNHMSWTEGVARLHDMLPGDALPVEERIQMYVPEHQPIIRAAMEACRRDGTPYDLELEKITATGRHIWVRTIGQAVRDENGEIIRLQGSFQDITLRKRLEVFKSGLRTLLEDIATRQPLEQIMHRVVVTLERQFPKALCCVMLLDKGGKKLALGASDRLSHDYLAPLDAMQEAGGTGFCTLAAREKRTLIVRDIEAEMIGGSFREHALACGLRACWSTPILSSTHTVLGTLVLYHREPFEPSEEEKELVNDYARTLGIAIERHQSEERIEQLAFYDPMTHLPNRQLLMDRLGQRLAASTRSQQYEAVLFIDLDNFKMLNDTHGHDIGDLLLVEVAHRIVSCVRESDTVSRLGGDEFVVIVENLDECAEQAAAQVRIVCDKIIAAFSQPFLLKGYVHHATPSIGVTLFNGQMQTTVEELLRRADLAMYRAKDSGRNCYRFFDQKMQMLVSERVQLEEDMRTAIVAQQFELLYQPQVDRQCGIIGAEALLRWRHPQHGLVSPDQFITQAEESGLILPIGHWVIETACEQLVRWAKDPLTSDLMLSINISARQCLQPDFVEEVQGLLAATGANPQRLMLELTESVLVDNVDEIITRMNALKAQGVGFALDDFGTGYSSLSYLKRMPFDQVKIDRSFVRDVMHDQNDASIVRTIVSLGLLLDLQVVAEGVETQEQLDFLQEQECHLFQGYLFGMPLKLEEFETTLREGKHQSATLGRAVMR